MKRLTVLLAASLLLVACSKEEAPPEPVRPVLSMQVKSEDQETLGRFAGTIQARYESNLGFRVPGRIARRAVDVGAEVEKGALLAVLDPTDQQNQLRAAQGDLARVQAQFINAQANARRQQELFNRGVGAQAQLDVAQTDLKTTQATLDQAKASVNQAKDQLNYAELRTDHAGIVTAWNAEAGQVVSAGQQVVTLARPDIKEAVIDLPAGLAERLPPDVVFLVAGQLDPSVNTTAIVREIEPQAQSATRTRRARLTLTETPAAFRLGTAISVTLSSAIAPRIELPLTALQEVDGKTRIWLFTPAVTMRSPGLTPPLSKALLASRLITVTSRGCTVWLWVSSSQMRVLPSTSCKALTGSWMRGAMAVLKVTLIAVPRRKAGGVSVRVNRARRVRVALWAWGSISRTMAVVLTLGSSWPATTNTTSVGRRSARPAGRSITASLMSGRARVTTCWPALTTWPASAFQAVTIPAWSVRNSA